MLFDQVYSLNNQSLTDKYIASLDKNQRIALIPDIVDLVLQHGLIYPDDQSKLIPEWNRIKAFTPDLSTNEIYNNSSVGTYICKYFCKDFYNAKGPKDKKTIAQLLQDKPTVEKLVYNRLGLEWFDQVPGTDGTFTLSPKMMIQGLRSMRLVSQITLFKPTVYKYLVEKYSQPGDTVYDYSCGWGARMLATIAANRAYIGTDPLTVPDLITMKDYFKLNNVTLLQQGSETYRDQENSVDFSCSSPAYYNQEIYSNDLSQAYNQGEDYFYNIYWKQTLDNIRYMLKPGKWFGLNVINYPKMVDLAREVFSLEVDIVKLRTTRSHLNKAQGKETSKFEPVYMFLNKK